MIERKTDDRPHDFRDEAFPSEADERLWVECIRNGDAGAYEAMYRAYWTPLYHFAFRYLQSQADAEEAVQEVFFKIWRRRTDLRPPGRLRSYLYLSVRNGALDRLRRAAVARKWREREVAPFSEQSQEMPVEMEAHLEAAEISAQVERALSELPPRRRAVCMLRLLDGLSYAQIANRLGISQKTVENQLATGLRFLRSQLRPPE